MATETRYVEVLAGGMCFLLGVVWWGRGVGMHPVVFLNLFIVVKVRSRVERELK